MGLRGLDEASGSCFRAPCFRAAAGRCPNWPRGASTRPPAAARTVDPSRRCFVAVGCPGRFVRFGTNPVPLVAVGSSLGGLSFRGWTSTPRTCPWTANGFEQKPISRRGWYGIFSASFGLGRLASGRPAFAKTTSLKDWLRVQPTTAPSLIERGPARDATRATRPVRFLLGARPSRPKTSWVLRRSSSPVHAAASPLNTFFPR